MLKPLWCYGREEDLESPCTFISSLLKTFSETMRDGIIRGAAERRSSIIIISKLPPWPAIRKQSHRDKLENVTTVQLRDEIAVKEGGPRPQRQRVH